MTAKELDIVLHNGEGYKSEFKEQFRISIQKEIVAFANSSGGRIFIGISDKGTIKGFALNNKIKSQITDLANNCDPAINIEIEAFKNVVIINIPEGTEKPYSCSSGYYYRSGANSQKMKTKDLIEFFQTEGKIRFDEILNENFDLNKDFDNSAYKSYSRIADIPEKFDKKDILANLGIIDTMQKKTRINNAGVLLFAKNPTRFHLHSVITGVLYKGNEKLNILDRKDFSSNIIENIEDAITFLKKHLNLSYKIESTRRKEIPELPETALREAVVNAVVHRDYFQKGANVLIEIFDDRVDISNPGGLPKGMTAKEFGRKSVARNPLLAALMLRAGYIEKLGTGIKRILQSLKEAGLEKPIIDYDGFFTISFNRRIKTEINVESYGVNINDRLGIKGKRLKRLLKIIQLIGDNKVNSQSLLVTFPSISKSTIEKDLALLRDNGFIEFVGPPKTGCYKIIDSEN